MERPPGCPWAEIELESLVRRLQSFRMIGFRSSTYRADDRTRLHVLTSFEHGAAASASSRFLSAASRYFGSVGGTGSLLEITRICSHRLCLLLS
jgi:hypothetical protein